MLSLQKIGFFNPGRLSDSEIEQAFIARLPFFEFLLKKIVAEKPDTIPQHYLVIGQRGMGKSSLLMRIAAELRKPAYKESFIPLSFPEEQYNLDRLSKFWLNCLDALADALDKEKATEDIAALDKEIANISRSQKATDAMAVYAVFENWIARLGRRPVLLVDNLNLIFSKLTREEQHQLRAILISRNAPVLVGASASVIDETLDYDQPFYDAFHIQYLKKLDFRESIEVLVNLAKLTGNARFEKSIFSNEGRLQALYQLTGGTPRTIAILFPLVQEGFSDEIQTDLDALLDIITPLYKARFDELPEQLQVVMDAVALHWDPINLEQLRDTTLLENPQLSPQLKRLVDMGWLQRLEAYQAKGGAYELTERFFNIWYLMRRSSRRQKRELYLLTRFLESFYGGELDELAQKRLEYKSERPDQIAFDLALADALKDGEVSQQLKKRSYDQLIDLSLENVELSEQFSIPIQAAEEKTQALFKQLHAMTAQNPLDEINEIIQKLVKIGWNSPQVWWSLAEWAESAGDYPLAEKFYTEVTQFDAGSADAWNRIGILYSESLSNPEEAEKAFQKSIELGSQNAARWRNLGRLYGRRLENFPAAEQAFFKAIELDPGNASDWIALGSSCIGQNKYPEAEKALEKALQLDNHNPNLFAVRGQLFLLQGKMEDADRSFKRFVELNPNSIEAWVLLGNLYHYEFRNYPAAEQAYKRAVDLQPNNAEVWRLLGHLYKVLERYENSELAYEKCLLLDATDLNCWLSLGLLYQDYLARYEDAEKAYEQALYIDPDNRTAKYNLVFLWREKLAKPEIARQLLDSIEVREDEKDTFLLNQCLFAYYDRNAGIAEDYLKQALLVTKGKFPDHTVDDWYRTAAAILHLNFSESMLKVFIDSGYDLIYKPFFIAIKALAEKHSDLFLNSVAVEVREPAKAIIKLIEKL